MDVVVFDKTGTLTLGRPSVLSCNVLDDALGLPQLCRLMAAAESASEHPLARAILDFCSETLGLGSAPSRSLSGGGGSGALPRLASAPSNEEGALALPVSHPASSLGGAPSPVAAARVTVRPWSWGGDSPAAADAGAEISPASASAGAPKLLPQGHDVNVVQGMGVTCWVEAADAGLTQQQAARFGGRPMPPSLPMSSGSGAGVPGRVLVVVGNRLLMQQLGVRLPDGLEEMVVPEVSPDALPAPPPLLHEGHTLAPVSRMQSSSALHTNIYPRYRSPLGLCRVSPRPLSPPLIPFSLPPSLPASPPRSSRAARVCLWRRAAGWPPCSASRTH